MFTLPLIANSLRVHSGYDNARIIGWNPLMFLPFCTDVERTHDIHHRRNMCNYGGQTLRGERTLREHASARVRLLSHSVIARDSLSVFSLLPCVCAFAL